MNQAIEFVHSLKIDNRREKKRNTTNPLFIATATNVLNAHECVDWSLLIEQYLYEHTHIISVPTPGCTPFRWHFTVYPSTYIVYYDGIIFYSSDYVSEFTELYIICIWSAKNCFKFFFHCIHFVYIVWEWRHITATILAKNNGQHTRHTHANVKCNENVRKTVIGSRCKRTTKQELQFY